MRHVDLISCTLLSACVLVFLSAPTESKADASGQSAARYITLVDRYCGSGTSATLGNDGKAITADLDATDYASLDTDSSKLIRDSDSCIVEYPACDAADEACNAGLVFLNGDLLLGERERFGVLAAADDEASDLGALSTVLGQAIYLCGLPNINNSGVPYTFAQNELEQILTFAAKMHRETTGSPVDPRVPDLQLCGETLGLAIQW